MFRWGCLVLGLLLFVLTSVDWLSVEPVAPAREISLEELRELAARGEPPQGLVRFEAGLDREARLHRSGLERPRHASCAPFEVVLLERDAFRDPAELARNAGCWVEIRAPLDPRTLAMQGSVEPREGDARVRHVRSEKLLSPVVETGLGLWVLSEAFRDAGEEAALEWLARPERRGKLARLADLDANRRDLGPSLSEIRELFSREHGITIPRDAWVVLADSGAPPEESVIERSRWLMPVTGGEGALFVELGLDDEAAHAGVLSGSLRALPAEDVADLALLLNGEVAARAAVLTPATAEVLNQRQGALHGSAFAVSLALAALGGGLVALQRRRGSAPAPSSPRPAPAAPSDGAR
jgi:hypothetical protein